MLRYSIGLLTKPLPIGRIARLRSRAARQDVATNQARQQPADALTIHGEHRHPQGVGKREITVVKPGGGCSVGPNCRTGLVTQECSPSKVEELLDKLQTLRKRIPVATSTAAAKRFRVSPDADEHKLVLPTGEQTLATLSLGDSFQQ